MQSQTLPDWWEELTPMLVSKGNSGSAVIDGRIYIVGGWNNIYISGIASTEVYNPETDSWSSCANMRFQRGGLTVETVNKKLYAIGGAKSRTANDVCDIVEEYDPQKNSWTIKNGMPGKRGWHCSCVLNDKIYIIGGLNISTFETSNFVYDPVTDEWDSIAPLNYHRQQASCCVFENKIYVFGGFNGNLSWEARTEVYDPLTNTWSVSSLIPGAFHSHHAFMYDNKIYNIGGGGITDDIHSEPVWMFDPASNLWQEMRDIPKDFMGSAQQQIGDYIYIFGGYTHSPGVQDFISKNEAYRINLGLLDIKTFSESNSLIGGLPVNIYPNPCDDVIYIEIENSDGARLEIYSVSGKLIFRKELHSRFEKIDISKMLEGIYFVKVYQKNRVRIEKLIVY